MKIHCTPFLSHFDYLSFSCSYRVDSPQRRDFFGTPTETNLIDCTCNVTGWYRSSWRNGAPFKLCARTPQREINTNCQSAEFRRSALVSLLHRRLAQSFDNSVGVVCTYNVFDFIFFHHRTASMGFEILKSHLPSLPSSLRAPRVATSFCISSLFYRARSSP